MKLQAVADCLGCIGEYPGEVCGYAQDSRLVKPGDLFFAIKGQRVDGHDYLERVAAQGAVAAVISSSYQGPSFGMHLLQIEDVLFGLQKLARQVQAERSSLVIAITGSVGKTTMKEFVCTLLEGKYRVVKTPGNANSQVGLPLALLNLQDSGDILVLEMGMSGAGQIRNLVSIAPPDIAVITTIGYSHAMFFENGIEGIAAAKSEIFSHPRTRLVVLGASAAKFPVCTSASAPIVYYGSQEDEYGMQMPFSAPHLVENVKGAIAVALACEMTIEEIAVRVAQLRPVPLRFEQIERQGITVVNDAYNASPTSMKAALGHLPLPKKGGKTIAVLGSMKELGMYEHESHQEVGVFAIEKSDHLLCIGPEWDAVVPHLQKMGKPVEHYSQFSALNAALTALSRPGDVVLVKGSNVHRLWELDVCRT